MVTTGFFRLPREVRDMVYEYLWQQKPKVITQQEAVELRADYRRFPHTEDNKAVPMFSLECARMEFTTPPDPIQHGIPAWLFANKTFLTEGLAPCGGSMAYDYRLLLPIQQHGKPLVVTFDAESDHGSDCNLISLNPAIEHLDNIGSFIKACSDAKELQININLGNVPTVTQLLMCYKLEQYLETTSLWDLDMDRVTITLRNKSRSQIRLDNAFMARVIKALGEAGRMVCGKQDVSESFVRESEPEMESVPLPSWSSGQLVWRYTAMKVWSRRL
jgi:hypothetical protein